MTTQINRTDRHFGGKSASPNPAWWEEDYGIIFRCQCGDLITFLKTDFVDGVSKKPVRHGCGFNDVVELTE